MYKRNGNRGQTLPLIGVLFFLLSGFGALAIDMGYINYQQMKMQTAADNAAIAGGQALIAAGCPNQAAANTAAQNNATTNGFGQSAQVNVTVDNPPKLTDGPYKGVNCAVSVMVNVQKNASWFLNLVGFAGMPITAQAVALLEQNNPGCIYLLTPGITSDFSNATIVAPNCAILTNGSANMSGATVSGKQIGYAGVAPTGGTFPDAQPTPMLPVADPCPEIAGCAYLKANPPPMGGCAAGGNYSNASLTPGCYQDLTLSNINTLQAGTYVVTDTLNVNPGATVTGNNVTIYTTAGTVNFAGATVNLSAPASGNTAGVLLYRPPGQTGPVNFGNCTCNLGGLVYFPATQLVTYGKGGGSYAVLVFGSASFSKQAVDLSGAPVNGSLIDNVVLVQ
jgi:hypothetical protein